MLKTNSKQVKLNVREWLKSYLDLPTLEGSIINFNSLNEYGKPNLSFVDFLINYECVLPFYYYDMRQLLGQWLEETEEEKNRYNDGKVAKTFEVLIARQIFDCFDIGMKTTRNKSGYVYTKLFIKYNKKYVISYRTFDLLDCRESEPQNPIKLAVKYRNWFYVEDYKEAVKTALQMRKHYEGDDEIEIFISESYTNKEGTEEVKDVLNIIRKEEVKQC